MQIHELQHTKLPCPWPLPSLLKLMSIELMMPANHLVLYCPLLLPLIFPSIRVFSNELALHIRWPKYWSFSISPSNEYWGLISFRIDSFDVLAVQGTLKSLLQHHSSKVSVLQCLTFFLILYWLCHTLTWVCHGCTRVPHSEPHFHFTPHPLPLGHPSAPAPSTLYPASNLDWRFVSHMIFYMFQCHSPISSRSYPLQ